MKPTDTYRLAITANDFKLCHALLRDNPMPGDNGRELSSPTIMAIRDGKVVGVLSTANLTKLKAIVVNTLRVDKSISNPTFVILHLIEAYEVILIKAGVRWYWAYVTKSNEKLVHLIQRVLGEPRQEDDGNLWFKREIA